MPIAELSVRAPASARSVQGARTQARAPMSVNLTLVGLREHNRQALEGAAPGAIEPVAGALGADGPIIGAAAVGFTGLGHQLLGMPA